jgi:hypothetical protein
MSIIIKSLTDTQLSSGHAEHNYQPLDRTAVVRNVRLANATTSFSATVKVQCQTGDGDRDTAQPPDFRNVLPVDLVVPGNGMLVLAEEITLNAGDALRITLVNPNAFTKLDVVVSGIEIEL